ncbi:MAG: MCE family protein [Ferruginibacter sp.]|nr:MCE family protein [Cytophagales bacterium]
MAADNRRSVMVGVFVLLALVILVAGIFTLGGQQKRFGKMIQVRTVFDNVAGLKAGNNVWFSGVKIGTVKRIDFSGNSQVEIAMNIEEDAQRYIRRDAKARLSSESLIGNKIIEIYGGNPQSPPVQDGDVLRSAPVLSTDAMMETLQENNQNLLLITNDFKVLSGKLARGEGMVGALLTDSTVADNFRSVVSGLQRASANTVRVSGALSRFTEKLDTKGGLANELLTDTLVFDQLKASINQLQQTTSSAAQMTDDLKRATQKLSSDKNAVGVLLNDEAFATDLKKTMDNLEASTEKFDENMEALQHNFLLRGFFKKKAKNKARPPAQ